MAEAPYTPLPERMRPREIAEVRGQEHLLAAGSPLLQQIESDQLASMILVGPAGSGKTTIARIIAAHTTAEFHALSAVSAGKADVTKVIAQAEELAASEGRRTILFLDEIHRFNKAQQDALLHAVEEGVIILIGATTESPGSSINEALRSRCRIYRLRELKQADLKEILSRAANELGAPAFDEEAIDRLARGFRDARSALTVLDETHEYAKAKDADRITNELIDQMPGQARIYYDKDGSNHYDTISAFIKSVRGSAHQAAIYYLAVMLAGGEDPVFIARRLMILAAEDVGLADPNALNIVASAAQICKEIGMPEARIVLSEATLYLCSVPKSSSAYKAIDAALETVKRDGAAPPPRYLTQLGSDSYRNPHDGPVDYQYLPPQVRGGFYRPTKKGHEAKVHERFVERAKQKP